MLGRDNQYHELDITVKELEDYRNNNPGCGICGRLVSHQQTFNGVKKSISLGVDHCHDSHKFRGLLCVCCNRSLEWSLRYKQEIQNYLENARV